MELIKGKQSGAIKAVVYGPEGIGKTTFAARFPDPVFIDTEGSTTHMDVTRTPAPSSWTMLLDQVRYFIAHPGELRTLVIDTADWAEKMCAEQLCASKQVDGLEGFGYGKGYIYLSEEFGKLLNLLEELRAKGVHIVMTAHATMRKFEQPDEMGAYDRWELKLSKKIAPMCKEWADMLLFVNYKTVVVNVDNQGAAKGKNKVQGGRRVMYATHHACWDAKNRFDLPDEMPFEFAKIAHLFTAQGKAGTPETSPPPATPPPTTPAPPPPVEDKPMPPANEERQPAPPPIERSAPPDLDSPVYEPPDTADEMEDVPKALKDLMAANGVELYELKYVVAQKGYFPADTPFASYPADFVSGALVGAWPKVLAAVVSNRGKVPF